MNKKSKSQSSDSEQTVNNDPQNKKTVPISNYRAEKNSVLAEKDPIPLSGTENRQIEGDIIFDGYATIVNCTTTDRKDSIVTLESLREFTNNAGQKLVEQDGGSIFGTWSLNGQQITELKTTGDNPNSLVNLEILKTLSKNKLNFVSSETDLSINKDFDMAGKAGLCNLYRSEEPGDSLTLKILKQLTNRYLSDNVKKNNEETILSSSMDMLGHHINNLQVEDSEESAINLQYVHDNAPTLFRKSLTDDPVIHSDLIFNNFTTIDALGNASEPGDIMNLRNFILAYEEEFRGGVSLNEASLKENVSISGSVVTGLQESNSGKNAVSMKKLEELFSFYLHYASDQSHIFSGDLFLDEVSKVKGIADPIEDGDAVNLGTAQRIIHDFNKDLMKNKNVILQGDLDCRGFGVYEVNDSEHDTDGVNVKIMKESVEKIKKRMPCIKTISLAEDLSMNQHSITNLSMSPKKDRDGVSYGFASSFIKSTLTSKCLSFLNNRLEGSLNMNGHKISDSIPGVNKSDSVTLGQFKVCKDSYLSIKGNTSPIYNHLYLSPDSRLVVEKAPQEDSEAVNLKTARNLDKMFLSSSVDDIITGDLIFDGQSYISGLSNPVEETDPINFRTLKQSIANACLQHISLGNPELIDTSLSVKGIVNLKNPTLPVDAVNVFSVDKALSYKIPVMGTGPNHEIQRDFDFQHSYKITGVSEAQTDYETVNLKSLKKIISAYISTRNTTDKIEINSLYFDGHHGLKGLKSPQTDDELMNFITLKEIVEDNRNKIILEEEIALTKNLDLKGNRITGLKLPEIAQDAANLDSLVATFNQYVPLKGSSHPIDNTWELKKGARIFGFSDPVNPGDAMNLQTLRQLKTRVLTFKGSNLENPLLENLNLSGNPLLNIADAEDDYDGVSTQVVRNLLANSGLIPLVKINETVIVESDLNMNSHEILSLASAQSPTNLCNLGDLKKMTRTYLKTIGNKDRVIKGDWNLNGRTVRNIRDPKNPEDMVNLKTLNTYLDGCLPLTTGNTSLNKNLSFGKIYGLSGLRPAQDESQVAVLANLKTIAEDLKNKFISRSNNCLKSNIDMQGHRVSSAYIEEEDTNALSLGLFKTFTENLISKLSPEEHTVITGPVFFNGITKPTGLVDPEVDSDALNLRVTRKNILSEFVSSKNNTIGHLDANHHMIKNHGIAQEDHELVTFKLLRRALTDTLISGGDYSLNYDLILSEHKIRGGSPRISVKEALRFSDLKQIVSNALDSYLSVNGGVFASNIDMNEFSISQTDSSSALETSALTLGELKSKFSTFCNALISLSGNKIFQEGDDLDINLHSIVLENDYVPETASDCLSLKTAKKIINEKLCNYLFMEDLEQPEVPVSLSLNGNLDLNDFAMKSYKESKEAGTALTLSLLQSWLSQVQYLFVQKTQGTVNGLIMNSHTISGVTDGEEDTDGINVRQLEHYLESYLSLKGTTVENPIKGDLQFDENAYIKNLKKAFKDDHLVNVATLKTTTNRYLENFVSSDKPLFQRDLFIKTGLCENIKAAELDNELSNLNVLTTFSDSFLNVQLKESPVSTSFVFNPGKCFKNLRNPGGEIVPIINELMSYGALKKACLDFQKEFHNTETMTLSNDLNMKNFSLTTSLDFSEENEAVPLKEFQNTLKAVTDLLQKKNAPWHYDLYMNDLRIKNLGDPLSRDSLINLKTIKAYLKNLIPLTASDSKTVITGNIIFDKDSSIEIKRAPVEGDDVLNVQAFNNLCLNSQLTHVSRNAPRFQNTIDMQNHFITAKPGTEDNDAVIYEQIESKLHPSFIYSKVATEKTILWKAGEILSLMSDSERTTDIISNEEGFTFSEGGIYLVSFCITKILEKKTTEVPFLQGLTETSSRKNLTEISGLLTSNKEDKTIMHGYLKSSKSLALSTVMSVKQGDRLHIHHNSKSDIKVSRISYSIIRLINT